MSGLSLFSNTRLSQFFYDHFLSKVPPDSEDPVVECAKELFPEID